MAKDEIVAKITRVVCHELHYGTGGIMTAVTIESGDVEDNEDRHVSTIGMVVEYKGLPHHTVGDKFSSFRNIVLSALEIVG